MQRDCVISQHLAALIMALNDLPLSVMGECSSSQTAPPNRSVQRAHGSPPALRRTRTVRFLHEMLTQGAALSRDIPSAEHVTSLVCGSVELLFFI